MMCLIFRHIKKNTSCGTASCALGECPTIWKSWVFNGNVPGLAGVSIHRSTRDWFEISSKAGDHLFYQGCQQPDLFGGSDLGWAATAKEVADNIRAFVALKVEGEGL